MNETVRFFSEILKGMRLTTATFSFSLLVTRRKFLFFQSFFAKVLFSEILKGTRPRTATFSLSLSRVFPRCIFSLISFSEILKGMRLTTATFSLSLQLFFFEVPFS